MELVSNKPLDKISVKEIVDNTDLSRQTFYRHFKDKHYLINWSLKVILDQLAKEIQAKESTQYQALVKLLATIKNQEDFFIDAFKMDGQNALVDFFYQYSVINGVPNYISHIYNAKLQGEINFAYSFFLHGVIHSIIDWTLTGMKQSPEYLAELIIDNMPTLVKQLFNS